MDDVINRLSEIFSHFPGIGPKQARRFVYYLLKQNQSSLAQLAGLVTSLKKEVRQCTECYRFFAPHEKAKDNLCDICADLSRDRSQLLVVEKDIDLNTIRRLGVYNGIYFVLGGLVPILDKNPAIRIREKELLDQISQKSKTGELKEIIIALSVNREGDNTVDYLKELLTPLTTEHNLKLSLLGRGLSSGSEIEYLDTDTFENALENRH